MVKWANGSPFTKANAQKVYEEINSIGEKYTPHDVVERARDENSELHRLFEWDDSIAAEKYRETQARYVIRCLVITHDEETGKQYSAPIRSIVSTNERTKEYTPIKRVIVVQDAYEKLLEEARRELAAFRRKYETLSELEPVFEAIDEIIK